MISKTQTKETPFRVQHGCVSRRSGTPNDDVELSDVIESPEEWFVDGYASTLEEAKRFAAICHLKEDKKNRYSLWFEISEGKDWDEESGEYWQSESMEIHDYWMEGLKMSQKERREAISDIMMRAIDLESPARTSIVLLKALRERMKDTNVRAMTRRDEVEGYVQDKRNWDGEAYEPELAMRLLDVARKKAMGALSKDYFEEDE